MARRPRGKMLTAIVENLREAAFGIDKNGKIIVINDKAKALMKDPDVKAEGKEIWDVMEINDFVRAFVSMVKDPNPQPLEQLIPFPDRRVYQCKMFPVYGRDERLIGAVAVVDDVTDLQKMGQTMNDFVARVSHELKTPLTSIKGFVETLLEGAMQNPEINRRFLQVINEETNRLTRLVLSLLDLTSLITENGAPLETEPLNSTLFIREAVKLFEPVAQEKHIILTAEVPDNLPTINASADKLRQVMINLVDNAIKYTGVKGPGGSVKVRAATNGTHLKISVIDSGVGIPKIEQPLVFEKFYRVQEGPSSELGGTGLGLAITKEIIESHGGTISVESEPDKGSKFLFTIPIS